MDERFHRKLNADRGQSQIHPCVVRANDLVTLDRSCTSRYATYLAAGCLQRINTSVVQDFHAESAALISERGEIFIRLAVSALGIVQADVSIRWIDFGPAPAHLIGVQDFV